MVQVRGRGSEESVAFRWYRLGLEAFAIVMAPIVASQVERLEPAGVVLVSVATIGVILLLRLAGDSEADTATWPRLPAPERGGRRAEIYRLSWQLIGERNTAPAVAAHLQDTIAHLRTAAPPEDQAELDALDQRLARHTDRAALDQILSQVEAYLERQGEAAWSTTRPSSPQTPSPHTPSPTQPPSGQSPSSGQSRPSTARSIA